MYKYPLILTIVICMGMQASAQEYYGEVPGQKLDWVFYYLSENYVDSLDNNRLADVAINRIVEELDPFSSYQSKEEADAQLNRDNGVSAPGAGMLFFMIDKKYPVITYINKGGPAEKAGLKRGYTINSINKQSTIGRPYDDINAMINDTLHKELTIDYLDHNNNEYTTTLVKEYFPWFSILSSYMIDNTTGYIKISSFTKNTMEEWNVAIQDLKNKGVKNLILDLRGNSGGVKDQSIDLADEFLSEGKIINVSRGHKLEDQVRESSSKGSFLAGKVICLIDNNTASASEIFVSAIQEWDRGLVLGFPSYGKGLIQQSYKLGDGSTIRLTIGRYYTPTGRNVQKPVNDSWFQNLGISIPDGTSMASLNLADSYFAQTKSKRKILVGTGGIYPDIYFIGKKVNQIALDKYNSGGYIYDFTTHYIYNNRKNILASYNNAEAFRKDERYMVHLSNEFKAYLAKLKFEETKDPDFGIPRNILDQIRSWIASQIWNDNAYYQLLNVSDQTISKALMILEDGTYDRIIRN